MDSGIFEKLRARDLLARSSAPNAFPALAAASMRKLALALKPALFSDDGSKHAHGATAYLDGLRGWAALLVYMTHHMLAAHMWLPLELEFGHGGTHYFVAFPFIRTLFTGSHMAVHIFFVISGYVLSQSTFRGHREGASIDKLVSSLASALCRRFVRLWTPVAVTTFLTMTLGYMMHQRGAQQEPTYMQECTLWWNTLFTLSHPFSTIGWMDWNPHTWTIPYEFRGSVYVLLALFATIKMTTRARILVFLGVACYTHYFAAWGCSTFLFGAFLANLDLLPHDQWPRWDWLLWLQQHKVRLYCILIPFALHLAGQPMLSFGALAPDAYENTGGYYYLFQFIPPNYFGKFNDFWYTFGAIIIVTAATNLPGFKRLFETRFTQYLGRHSFGLYLVHGPVLFLLGTRMYAATGLAPALEAPMSAWNNLFPISNAGPTGLEVSFFCCQIVLFPLTLYLAELCTKFIDGPSMTLSRHLYQRILA